MITCRSPGTKVEHKAYPQERVAVHWRLDLHIVWGGRGGVGGREEGRREIADLFHSFRELDEAERIFESSELKHTVLKFMI